MIEALLIRDYDRTHGERLWLGFPANTKPDEARQWFTRRFGYRPIAIHKHRLNNDGKRLLLAGPVIEIEEKHT